MRDYVFGAWRDVVVKRDGSVLVDGEPVGCVWGAPRRWLWLSRSGRDGGGNCHSKRDAATACAQAVLERAAAERGGAE